MRTLPRRYPTTTFVIATFLVTWVVWVPNAIAPDTIVGAIAPFWTYGPAIGAVIAAAMTGRLRDLGARMVRWRVGWLWYVVVLFGPAAFWAVVMAVHAVLGRSGDLGRPTMLEESVAALVPLFVLLALTDGLGEETGWRGFALPRLLEWTAPLTASLVLGVIWAVWHLPLFWTEGRPLHGGSPVVLLMELPAMAVLFTWVFQHTDGSALLAIFFHASWNLSAQSAAQADSVEPALIILALKWALAGVVIAYWQRRRQTTRLSLRRPAA